MFDIENIRRDFPMLQDMKMNGCPLIYLDSAATSFKPQPVIDAVDRFYRQTTANIHRGDYELSYFVDRAYDETRDRLAGFLNCDSREVVFTSGTTAGLNLVAFSWGRKNLGEGDVVLLNYAEHASNVLPWFRVCEETGARIEYVELDEYGRLTAENVRKALHDRVKVISFAAVTNVLGNLAPVREIAQLAHANGTLVVVDGAQSVPHMKTDVREWDCDFLAFSGHKMLGPSGTGALYGRFDILDQLDPPAYGGGANARFMKDGEIILQKTPVRFEAGTPNIEGVLGLGAAVDYLQGIGMENVEAYEAGLRDYMNERLKQLDNVEVYNEKAHAAIAAFNVKNIFAQDASGYLASRGLALRSGNHCAKLLVNHLGIGETIRASLYLYNEKNDIDALVEALRNCTIENCIGVFF